jgi:hypothetical protein
MHLIWLPLHCLKVPPKKSTGKQLKIKRYNHIAQIVLRNPNRHPINENNDNFTLESYI